MTSVLKNMNANKEHQSLMDFVQNMLRYSLESQPILKKRQTK